MATAQDVIDRARQLINDVASGFVAGLRWSDAELLQWLTDGQREIVVIEPEANAITDIFTVTASPRQSLSPTLAYKLIRVEANGSAGESEPDTAPEITAADGGSPPGINVSWNAAAFGDGESVTSYQIYSTDAQTFVSSINFGASTPTIGDMTLVGTVDDLVLTYDDAASADPNSTQSAYIVRAIGSLGGQVDSGLYYSQAIS